MVVVVDMGRVVVDEVVVVVYLLVFRWRFRIGLWVMNPFLLIVLFLIYIPVALLCLLAALFRQEQVQLRNRERLSQEWLSRQAQQVLYPAQQVLREDRQERL